MSRMILSAAIALVLSPWAMATDGCITPYNKRPFSTPLAPCPNGVLAGNACFGYFQTKWTPWQLACQDCAPTTPPVVHTTTTRVAPSGGANKGIILYEQPGKVVPAGQLVPSPEQVRLISPPRP
jgi:hypothetical protein